MKLDRCHPAVSVPACRSDQVDLEVVLVEEDSGLRLAMGVLHDHLVVPRPLDRMGLLRVSWEVHPQGSWGVRHPVL